MSNTRKLRQPGGDRERERRHMAWLNQADNAAMLAAGAQAAYEDQGRGFWFASADQDATATGAALAYVPQAAIGELPPSRNRDAVARMVATYDPAVQVVVVLQEGGNLDAYKVRPVPIDPALN